MSPVIAGLIRAFLALSAWNARFGMKIAMYSGRIVLFRIIFHDTLKERRDNAGLPLRTSTRTERLYFHTFNSDWCVFLMSYPLERREPARDGRSHVYGPNTNLIAEVPG